MRGGRDHLASRPQHRKTGSPNIVAAARGEGGGGGARSSHLLVCVPQVG